MHEWHEKRDSDKKIYRIVTDGVWLILSSVILLYMVELVEQNLANIGAEYIFGNIVIYLLFLMMVYMLVRSIFYSVSAVMLVIHIFRSKFVCAFVSWFAYRAGRFSCDGNG